MFEHLVESAIYYDLPLNDYWNMTLAEIKKYFNIKNNKEKNQIKWEATLIYREVDLIATSIARLFKGNVQFPKISKVFPSLFEENNIDDMKEQFRKRAMAHNATRKEVDK